MTTPARAFRRNQRVEYSYAGGKVVPGKILHYQDMDNVRGRPDLRGLMGWYAVRLSDEAGDYTASVHEGQLRSIDNVRSGD